MAMYVKDQLRNEIYAVIFKHKNNILMINAETAKKPFVLIRLSDLYPDERFREVPDHQDH